MEAFKLRKGAEDCVEYKLYPDLDPGLKLKDIESRLEQVQQECFLLLKDDISSHIWQEDPFNLSMNPAPSKAGESPHLFGKTRFGDNIEDEWYIVYLLMELTRKIPGLVVKVDDNDGEFLLIEAADHLPKWLEPDTAENRVFLYNNEVHIVRPPQNPAEVTSLPSGTPDLPTALKCIRNTPKLTRATQPIQASIRSKIQRSVESARKSQHRTHCYIPASLAAILNASPDLVAPMVQAFYCRDPLDLKACVTFKYFRPGTRVLSEVRITRCLYAQLMQQQFIADRRSGYSHPPEKDPKYTAHDLGIKLVHGAEILCLRCDSNSNGKAPTSQGSNSDSKWNNFLTSLKSKGYFKGEIEGSQLYNQLLKDARRFYENSASLQDSDAQGSGARILHLLKTVKFDLEKMRKEEKNLGKPDDDSWLNLSEGDLDAMLREAYGTAATTNLQDVTKNMKDFVQKPSSYKGVEVKGDDDEDGEVTIDPDRFIHNMQKMFDFQDEKDTSSEDDMSEYGSDIDPDDLEPRSGEAVDNEMLEMMREMDRQLAKTTIGQSFTKEETQAATQNPTPPPRRQKQPEGQTKPTPAPRHKKHANKSSSQSTAPAPSQASQASQSVPSGGACGGAAPKAQLDDEIDDMDDDDFQPVNVDLNLVQNLLDSHSAQQGLAGPASSILGSMGMRLPPDTGN